MTLFLLHVSGAALLEKAGDTPGLQTIYPDDQNVYPPSYRGNLKLIIKSKATSNTIW
jgi:hypothetical protein